MPLEIQAQALYDVLEAIFDYADAHLEPKGVGLMTFEKLKQIIYNSGVTAAFDEFLKFPPSMVACQYRAMGTQMHMLPPYNPGASPYDFREPDQPAVTKAGWIKGETIGLIIDGEGDTNYRLIQGCIAHHNLRIKNPSPGSPGRYMPLPEKQTVQWYARSLAPSIGIDPEGLTERLSRRFTQLLGAQSAPAMTPERFAGERERLQQQERENQLSAIRVNMANASIRRAADSIDILSGVQRTTWHH